MSAFREFAAAAFLPAFAPQVKPQLEQNPQLIAHARQIANLIEGSVDVMVTCELRRLADALEHTHAIATAGWLDTKEDSNDGR